MNKRASRPEAWFEKAEHDLEMIRRAMTADGAPWDMVTFHAQQAAEKYLKGFLVARGIDPPKIHDLRTLLLLCRDYDATLAPLDNGLSRPDPTRLDVPVPRFAHRHH